MERVSPARPPPIMPIVKGVCWEGKGMIMRWVGGSERWSNDLSYEGDCRTYEGGAMVREVDLRLRYGRVA